MRRFSPLFVLLLIAGSAVVMAQATSQNPHGKLKWDCQSCHTSESWTKMRDTLAFDHGETGFTLEGAHATAQCIGCHRSTVFSNVGVSCVDCHTDHHQGQLGQTCQNCHTPRDWQNRQDVLELHAQRGFALTGVHAVADCDACHQGVGRQEFAGTPMDCQSCHTEAFQATTDPSHMAAGFASNCELCHRSASGSWQNTNYTHPAVYPLTGAHKQLDCKECHTSVYTGTPSTCYDCHSTVFEATTSPNHVQSGFTHECTVCHTTTTWSPAHYDHNATGFPLTGKHLTAACVACHASGYAGTPTACYSCHQTDFQGVREPDHVLANFDHNCTACHSTTGWTPSTFSHAATSFPLTGKHATALCSACHATGFAGTPTDCYSCHQTDFQGTTDPNHVTNNFSHLCSTCHSTSGWAPSTFDHSATAFPLTGKHVATTCISCHASGYTGTPTDCYSCHQTDFQGTTDPNHATNNFSHLCGTCHSTSAWSPATFDHSATAFPLTGAHTTTACVACHSSGYASTPTACYACHKSEYDGTTNPIHSAANFPTTCETCHSTSNWTSTTWDHDSQYFPIYSGSHAGRWSLCSDCHTNAASYSAFECTTACHGKSSTDSHHTQVSNYQYLSSACYSCHPRGRN